MADVLIKKRQIEPLKITDSDVAPNANISTNKLADGSLFIKSDGSVPFEANQSMGSFKLTDLAEPTDQNDAVRLIDLQLAGSGIHIMDPVRVATSNNITLSGLQTISGIALAAGDRVLVKEQTDATENGIYTVVDGGTWTRSPDADEQGELQNGSKILVQEGDYAGSSFVCTSPNPIELGTDDILWRQDSQAILYTAGAGLNLVNTTFSVGTASSNRIKINANNIDLATTGVTAGTYTKVQVDAYGRVQDGSNPATLAGYGITDAYTKTQIGNFFNGTSSMTGYNKTDWDDAADKQITGITFNTGSGLLTLTTADASNFTKNLDGRYSLDTHTHALNDLSDVSLTSPSNTQLLRYNGTNWVNWSPDFLVSSDVSNSTITLNTGGILTGGGTFTLNQSTNKTINIAAPATDIGLTGTTGARVITSSTGTDATLPLVTTALSGLMSPGDKTKLNNIQAGAEVNVQTDWNETDDTSDAYLKNKPTLHDGTVTTILSGDGMDFSTITATGTVTLGTPSAITLVSSNSLSDTSHTHAFVPGGTTAQYIDGTGGLKQFPTDLSDFNNDLTAFLKYYPTGTFSDFNQMVIGGEETEFFSVNSGSTLNSPPNSSTTFFNNFTFFGSSTGTQIVISNNDDRIWTRAIHAANDYGTWKEGAFTSDIKDGTLTLATSGIATGSASFTANQSGDSTFTVNVPATNITASLSDTTITLNSSTGTGDSVDIGSILNGYATESWVTANFDDYESWNLQVNSVQKTTIQSGGVLNLIPGSNISIAYGAGGAVTINSSNPGGSVTSVGLSAPTGFIVNNTPITDSGTLQLEFDTGYSLPSNTKQTSWDNKQDALGTATGGKYLYQDQTWRVIQYSDLAGTPSIPSQYTDEMAQDAVGTILSTEFTYNDTTPSISISTVAATKVVEDTTHRFVTDNQISNWNGKAEVSDIKDGQLTISTTSDLTGSTTFTANQSTNSSVSIGLTSSIKNLITNAIQPGDNVSDLTNDAGYITNADIPATPDLQDVTEVGNQTNQYSLFNNGMSIGRRSIVSSPSTNTFTSGILIKTDISDTESVGFYLDISGGGNNYINKVIVSGYRVGTSGLIHRLNAITTNSEFLTASAFIYEGFLCFWLDVSYTITSFAPEVQMYISFNDKRFKVTSITNEAKPTGLTVDLTVDIEVLSTQEWVLAQNYITESDANNKFFSNTRITSQKATTFGNDADTLLPSGGFIGGRNGDTWISNGATNFGIGGLIGFNYYDNGEPSATLQVQYDTTHSKLAWRTGKRNLGDGWNEWQEVASHKWIYDRGVYLNQGGVPAGTDMNTLFTIGNWYHGSSSTGTTNDPYTTTAYNLFNFSSVGYRFGLASSGSSQMPKVQWGTAADLSGWKELMVEGGSNSLLNNTAGYLTTEVDPVWTADKAGTTTITGNWTFNNKIRLFGNPSATPIGIDIGSTSYRSYFGGNYGTGSTSITANCFRSGDDEWSLGYSPSGGSRLLLNVGGGLYIETAPSGSNPGDDVVFFTTSERVATQEWTKDNVTLDDVVGNGNTSNTGIIIQNGSGDSLILNAGVIELNRTASYLRPKTNDTNTLYIGGSSSGTNDWSSINIFSTGGVSVNGKKLATENWVTDQNYLTSDKWVANEIVSGTINGTNKIFTLANTPVAGTQIIYLNGNALTPGAGNGYTISGSTITMTIAPKDATADSPADSIMASYFKQ